MGSTIMMRWFFLVFFFSGKPRQRSYSKKNLDCPLSDSRESFGESEPPSQLASCPYTGNRQTSNEKTRAPQRYSLPIMGSFFTLCSRGGGAFLIGLFSKNVDCWRRG